MSNPGQDSRGPMPDGTAENTAAMPSDSDHNGKAARRIQSSFLPALMVAWISTVLFLGLFHIVWADSDLHFIPKKNFTYCLTFSSLATITFDYRNKPSLDAFNDDEHLNHLVRELCRRGVIKVK